ncbi:MAG: hypothetical protein DRO11_04105 [Methanobacteriota archaeon]|nr:MAG: hypothetical protein DRO11_04105 [Euryarchaeota archaeon]
MLGETPKNFFPYPEFYPFQEELVRTIHSTVSEGRSIVVQAATGTGKTVAALSALLPVALSNEKKIVWATRTHTQAKRVVEETEKIHEKRLSDGGKLLGISIIGRKEMCPNPKLRKNVLSATEAMILCSKLKKEKGCEFFAKIWEQADSFLEKFSRPITAEKLISSCSKSGVCAYEIAKLLVARADVVSCNYHHVFNPTIRDRFIKHLGVDWGDVILVVDEAHNLDRFSLETSSNQVTLKTLDNAIDEANKYQVEEELLEVLEEIRNGLLSLPEKVFGGNKNGETIISSEKLIETVNGCLGYSTPKEFYYQAEEILNRGETIREAKASAGQRPASSLHKLGEFLVAWYETRMREDYARILTTNGETFKLELCSLDPRNLVQPIFSQVYASLSMSGTLEPRAYRKTLGLPKNSGLCYLPNPFPPENRLVLIDTTTTTLAKMRTPKMYENMAEKIVAIVNNTPSNILVFTASYEVLDNLFKTNLPKKVKKKVYRETQGATPEKSKDMMENFKREADSGGAVWFGVMKGRHSEGEDFPRGQANAVILVGLPYPESSVRIKAQIKYYNKVFPGVWIREHGRIYTMGEYYAYWLPSYYALAQAAGRVHRSHKDRGIIFFLENRVFTHRKVRESLPKWLTDESVLVRSVEDVELQTKNFWGNNNP